jgi:hypothetical protein
LRERHKADSSASILAFTYDPSDAFVNGAPCVSVPEAEVPQPPHLGRVPWWPKTLLTARRGGLRLFRCTQTSSPGSSRQAWLALDVARGEAFLWRPSR